MQDPNPQVAGRGLYRLQQAGIDVSHGLMMSEVEQLNKGFLKRMRTGFPYLQLKLGASLDGRTAMASGESQWITSPQARRDVQRLRAQSHAILTSSATVLADDLSLPCVGRSLGSQLRRVTRRKSCASQSALFWIARIRSRRSTVLCNSLEKPGLSGLKTTP
jgi:diaminohydroxyphosphoribosylaminopyrimidine deaminase/5-amino-6-(5-phosphoribosylamino)uracil reductase